MSWEARKGRGRYYTRSRRVGGRLVREYVGSGRVAELLANFDQQKREERLITMAETAKRRAEDAAVDALVDEVCQLAELLGRAALLDAGFHFHRGQWRKRRAKAEKTARND